MLVYLHKNFLKQYRKIPTHLQSKFRERRDIFLVAPFHPLLNNHALSGEYTKYPSINITADLRVLYEPLSKDVALFITIDTHSNLYK